MASSPKAFSPTHTSAADLPSSSTQQPEQSTAPPNNDQPLNPSEQGSQGLLEERGGLSTPTTKVHSTDAPLEGVQAPFQTLSHNSPLQAATNQQGETGAATSSGYETPADDFEEVIRPAGEGDAGEAPTGASGRNPGGEAPLASETDEGTSIAKEREGASSSAQGASEEGHVQKDEEINLGEGAFEAPLAAVAGLLPPSPEILLRTLRKKKGARMAVPKGTPQGLVLQLNWRFIHGRPQLNPMTQHRGDLATPLGFTCQDRAQFNRYNFVSSRKITPTKFLCLRTTQELGIFDDVQYLLKKVGVYRLARASRETRKGLVCEFFSSVEFEGEGDPKLKFRLGSRDWVLTANQFREIFALPAPTSAGAPSGAPISIKDFWGMISEHPYVRVAQTGASQVFSLVFRYVMRLMAFIIFLRGDNAQKVRHPELELLRDMVLSDGHAPDLALTLMKELAGAANKPGEICAGGIITLIAEYLNKAHPGSIEMGPTLVQGQLLDLKSLLNMKVIKKEGDRYAIHDSTFHLKIYLPDKNSTSVKDERNWKPSTLASKLAEGGVASPQPGQKRGAPSASTPIPKKARTGASVSTRTPPASPLPSVQRRATPSPSAPSSGAPTSSAQPASAKGKAKVGASSSRIPAPRSAPATRPATAPLSMKVLADKLEETQMELARTNEKLASTEEALTVATERIDIVEAKLASLVAELEALRIQKSN